MHEVEAVALITGSFTLLAGLGGQFASAWLASRREENSRKHAYILRQVEEFYAPLVSLMEEFLQAGYFHFSCTDGEQAMTPEEKIAEEAVLTAMNEYNSRLVHESAQPSLDKAAALIKEKHWLAEKSTQRYLRTALRKIELSKRELLKSLPSRVKAEFAEEQLSLSDFIVELNRQLDAKTKQLSSDKARGALQEQEIAAITGWLTDTSRNDSAKESADLSNLTN